MPVLLDVILPLPAASHLWWFSELPELFSVRYEPAGAYVGQLAGAVH